MIGGRQRPWRGEDVWPLAPRVRGQPGRVRRRARCRPASREWLRTWVCQKSAPRQFVGTRRFSSSVQCCTTMTLRPRGLVRAAAVLDHQEPLAVRRHVVLAGQEKAGARVIAPFDELRRGPRAPCGASRVDGHSHQRSIWRYIEQLPTAAGPERLHAAGAERRDDLVRAEASAGNEGHGTAADEPGVLIVMKRGLTASPRLSARRPPEAILRATWESCSCRRGCRRCAPVLQRPWPPPGPGAIRLFRARWRRRRRRRRR